MRSFVPLLIPALLAACGQVAEAPRATVEAAPFFLSAAPAFAAPRNVDAPPDPVLAAADGTRSVEVELVAPSDTTMELPYDPAAVQAEVERNAGHLQRCWAERLDALPVREGVVEIHAHIGPDGLVDGQCIGMNTVEDEAVQRCVNELLAMGRYPASAGTVDVTVQLRLSAPHT